MPKYESDNDKKQRTDAAAARQKQAQADLAAQNKRENRPAASQDPLHTNPDTASVQEPDEQAQQDKINKEIQDLRHAHHKDKHGVADEMKAQRLGEREARAEQRKGEMERKHEDETHPKPRVQDTNPTNITSPATHTGVDTSMGEGEP
jgi:hypothetical protein